MLKVLWFEVTIPSAYREDGIVVGGWQDSLEKVIKMAKDIELLIAFEAPTGSKTKVIDGVTYIPIDTGSSFSSKIRRVFHDPTNSERLVNESLKIINTYQPDIIHVFGNEWPFGLVSKFTKIPVVIHIQGSIVVYNNTEFPPGYSGNTLNPIKFCKNKLMLKWNTERENIEREIWENVKYYMGRTHWDKALARVLNPSAKYFHVDEALRPIFLDSSKCQWQQSHDRTIQLITTGSPSFRKGFDMMLKTANILKQSGVDFRWIVAGKLDVSMKNTVEKKEKLRMEDCGIEILGFTSPENLVKLLASSTLYVHTAYAENSPNSICEAQIIGLPVVSTNVGGIASLVEDGVDGRLVPANDPWQMADAIIQLSRDSEMLNSYSTHGKEKAFKRHSPESILKDLLFCYNEVLDDSK